MTMQKLIQLDYINAILKKLQSHYAEVLKMHFIDRLTYAEIAKEKGVHSATIGNQIKKALIECKHITHFIDNKKLEPIRFQLIVSTQYDKTFFLGKDVVARAQL